MTIYWTMKSIPELADLTARERGKAWRQNVLKAFRHWQGWLAMLVVAICVGGGAWVGSVVLSGPRGIAVVAVIAALGGTLAGQLMVAAVRPYLAARMNTDGIQPG